MPHMSIARKITIAALSVFHALVYADPAIQKGKVTETDAQGKPFFEDKERGWFWHESLPAENEPEEITPAPSTATQQKVELSTTWLKSQLPVLLDKAINNPTEANLSAYAYAQRLMLDQASRFSSKMDEFMSTESFLDESRRRPSVSFELNAFEAERSEVVKSVVKEVSSQSKGLFFFYASDCGFCHKMVPVLTELKRRHNLKILAVSMDGGVIPGMEGFDIVSDESGDVSRKFSVNVTPTIHLVKMDNSAELVAEGLKPITELEDRLLLAGRKVGLITKEMFAKTRSVREVNVFKNEDGNILADKERLESDPEYLAEILRMQLSDGQVFGTKVIRRN